MLLQACLHGSGHYPLRMCMLVRFVDQLLKSASVGALPFLFLSFFKLTNASIMARCVSVTQGTPDSRFNCSLC